MATGVAVSVEEYLSTVYEPDCEYTDGELIERNVGEYTHNRVQGWLYSYFLRRSAEWNIEPIMEQRIQIREKKFMIPDVCVMRGTEQSAEIITEPPLIWIEVLSREDRLVRVNKKVQEAIAFGTEFVWVIDPETFESYLVTKDSQTDLADGRFRIEDLGIEVSLPAAVKEAKPSQKLPALLQTRPPLN